MGAGGDDGGYDFNGDFGGDDDDDDVCVCVCGVMCRGGERDKSERETFFFCVCVCVCVHQCMHGVRLGAHVCVWRERGRERDRCLVFIRSKRYSRLGRVGRERDSVCEWVRA